MAQFIVCVAQAQGAASVAPCTDAAGVSYAPAMMALPDPGTVTFENANLLFSYGFQNVLIIWLIGLTVGAILSLIRRGQ